MDGGGFQSLIVYAALALLSIGLIGFATIGGRAALTTYRRRARLGARGAGPAPSHASLGARAMSQLTQGVRKLGGKVGEQEKDPEAQSALRMKLAQAGFTGRDAVAIYL